MTHIFYLALSRIEKLIHLLWVFKYKFLEVFRNSYNCYMLEYNLVPVGFDVLDLTIDPVAKSFFPQNVYTFYIAFVEKESQKKCR